MSKNRLLLLVKKRRSWTLLTDYLSTFELVVPLQQGSKQPVIEEENIDLIVIDRDMLTTHCAELAALATAYGPFIPTHTGITAGKFSQEPTGRTTRAA